MSDLEAGATAEEATAGMLDRGAFRPACDPNELLVALEAFMRHSRRFEPFVGPREAWDVDFRFAVETCERLAIGIAPGQTVCTLTQEEQDLLAASQDVFGFVRPWLKRFRRAMAIWFQ